MKSLYLFIHEKCITKMKAIRQTLWEDSFSGHRGEDYLTVPI